MPRTIIIGAGWAGFSCAYYLTKAGHTVTLLEAAPQSGGRARSIRVNDEILDNGQHICIGAYTTLRTLLRELNLDEKLLFNIRPNNLLGQLFKQRQIPFKDKIQALKFLYRIRSANFTIEQDCSVLALLKNYQQSDLLIKYFWFPLVISAMTTQIEEASAKVFINILKLTFKNIWQDSKWFFPATDLSTLLPLQVEKYLAGHGGRVIFNQAVKSLQFELGYCRSAETAQNSWQADNFVIATPPWQAANLLATHPVLCDIHRALNLLQPEPITTIYFKFPNPVNLPYPMLGMIDSLAHWIFDRAFVGQDDLLSVVISGSGSYQQLSRDSLVQTILSEIRQRFPKLKDPLWHKVINEKRAAFKCASGLQSYRPSPLTKISNLWLTGDYIDTGLPSSLEGALLSGSLTAGEIISPRSNHNC